MSKTAASAFTAVLGNSRGSARVASDSEAISAFVCGYPFVGPSLRSVHAENTDANTVDNRIFYFLVNSKNELCGIRRTQSKLTQIIVREAYAQLLPAAADLNVNSSLSGSVLFLRRCIRSPDIRNAVVGAGLREHSDLLRLLASELKPETIASLKALAVNPQQGLPARTIPLFAERFSPQPLLHGIEALTIRGLLKQKPTTNPTVYVLTADGLELTRLLADNTRSLYYREHELVK